MRHFQTSFSKHTCTVYASATPHDTTDACDTTEDKPQGISRLPKLVPCKTDCIHISTDMRTVSSGGPFSVVDDFSLFHTWIMRASGVSDFGAGNVARLRPWDAFACHGCWRCINASYAADIHCSIGPSVGV